MLVTNFVVNITEVRSIITKSRKGFINVFQFFNRAEHKKHNLFNQEEVFQFTDFLQIIWNECKGEVRFKKVVQHYMKMSVYDRHKKSDWSFIGHFAKEWLFLC